MFILSLYASCSRYRFILQVHVHVHVYFACPCCMSLLYVRAAWLSSCCMSCPCCMSCKGNMDVYATCSCCLSMLLLVNATFPCCMSVLHVRSACPCCIFVLPVHAECAWYIFMLHVPATCLLIVLFIILFSDALAELFAEVSRMLAKSSGSAWPKLAEVLEKLAEVSWLAVRRLSKVKS